jgi:hypothetical protein
LLLATPAAAQEYLPPGSSIEEGIGLDITEGGFAHILSLVGNVLPPDLTIGEIPAQELLEIPFICTETLVLENLIIHTEINSITIDGTPTALVLRADINMWLNTPDDAAIINFTGCLDYTCLLHSDPANIIIDFPLTLALATDDEGSPFIDVTFGTLSHNIEEAMANKVHMTGCAIGEINELLSSVGLNIFDLVIGEFVGQLEETLDETMADLEVTVEDALLALWLADTLEVLDAELTYDIHPTEVQHNDLGLRFVLGGSVSATPHQCIARYDDGTGSLYTASNLPVMTARVPETEAAFHLAGLRTDAPINQGFFAAWQGGVLCFVVEEFGSTTLTTTYLGLLLGLGSDERLAEILGTDDEVPMLVRTVPETPPVARFDGEHDIEVDVIGLNIQFYPVLLDRFANLASIAIDIHAGIDISLAPDDALQLDIYLDSGNLSPRVTYNEIAPDLNELLESNFTNFVGVVIDTVAGSLLEGMTIGLPTFAGQGLHGDTWHRPPHVGLDARAIGESASLLDFLGVYMRLGETDGGTSTGGCDSCSGDGGGCGDCGGDGGCGGDSCLGEGSGCSEDGTCDAFGEESGCSGEPSDQPDEVGCVGCRHVVAKRLPDGHWQVRISQEGVHARPVTKTFRVGLSTILVLLGPLLVLARRRRRDSEQPGL